METAKDQLRTTGMNTEVSVQEKAFLVHGTKKIPIYAECASKYSLSFKYLADQQLTSSDEPINLVIQNNGQSVELGPCRILSNPVLNGASGRLVFLNDVYDIHRLLKEKKAVKLQSAFNDLQLIFARKETIRNSFKEYTADLAFDLSVYKKIFDDLDSQYRDEPIEVRETIQRALIDTEKKAFNSFLDEKLDQLKHTVENYSNQEHQAHGYYFRKQLWNFILCCPIFSRTNLKPRGYAGDSEMMRMIYLNDYRGNSTFAKLFHKHGVEHPASQSVRNRIKLIAGLLSDYCTQSKFPAKKRLKILSVGSGSALELQSILKSPADCNKYSFTLIDQDSQALSEAAALASVLEKRFDRKIEVNYSKHSVRRMLFLRQLEQKMGQFHYIYSMGLFDYLATSVAKALLKRLYQLLKPGGEMVIGNFHISNPSKYYMEYWCDWVLFHRTEEDLRGLLKDIPSESASIIFEKTGSQMFLKIKKQENVL